MNDERAREYVDHVLKAIDQMQEWSAIGEDAFLQDERTQAAIARKLHAVTESVKRLAPLLEKRYPAVPWREVIGFRNVVVHDYIGLRLDRVWAIVVNHLPTLKDHMIRVRRDLP